jgi:hypothetical protein
MGMQADLHLTDGEFYNCLTFFCKVLHILEFSVGSNKSEQL